MEPFKRRLRSKTKADECKEHADDKGVQRQLKCITGSIHELQCITDKTWLTAKQLEYEYKSEAHTQATDYMHRAKECGLVRINPETALQPNDAPRPQLRLVWQDQEQFKEEEGTGGYKRPDAGKRTETRRSTKQRTGRATHNQRMKREGPFIAKAEQEEEPAIRAAPCLSIMCGASPTVKQEQFTSKETEEEKEDEEKQHKCNSVFGCGKCSCDQCYPPGDLPERGSFQTVLIAD